MLDVYWVCMTFCGYYNCSLGW